MVFSIATLAEIWLRQQFNNALMGGVRLFGNDYEWSVLAAGHHQMAFGTTAALLGGNLRVGLEDSLYIGKGELAACNADQVAKIRRIVEDLSLTVATPEQARARLGLKGGDRVGF